MKKETKNPTVGEEAYKRLSNPDSKQGIIDTQREIDKKYFEGIEECIKKHKGLTGFEKEFFIVVLAKKERVMENVLRRYYIARKSLPTPDYDQTVWRYKTTGDLEFIWVVPDHNTCQEMFHHPETVPVTEQDLLKFVQLFMNGILYHEACKKFGIEIDVDKNPVEMLDISEESRAKIAKHVEDAML